MTPDKLVTAAAERICFHGLDPMPCPRCVEKARNALAAAFAALPECDEMRCPVSATWHSDWVEGWNAAVARMGQIGG